MEGPIVTKPTAVIIEMDEERARKECLALDLKVAGATRELAQWLLDHPQYTAAQVARGVGCGETKIKQLRRWAQSGFSDEKHPKAVRRGFEDNYKRDRRAETARQRAAREDAEIAEPETIEANLHHYMLRMNNFARMFRDHFRLSAFDREAETRIVAAIDRTIEKWRSTQAIIIKRGRHGKSKE